MRQYLFISAILVIASTHLAKAQSLDSLSQLKEFAFPVYYSSGQQQRAEATAVQIEKAITYYQLSLEFKPAITLIILSAKDWDAYIAEPVVYGMPHYNDKNKRLIVAAEDNLFWNSFLPPLDQLPVKLQAAFRDAYSDSTGHISARAFFDLLAIHELGHAFHIQDGLTMQRNWMGELFVNIFLHTYIAEKEPEFLPALTLFPRMVVGTGIKGLRYTSLEDIHKRYNEIAQQYPKNYGWYQCRWHSAANDIYNTDGKDAFKKLWTAFKTQKEILSDQEFIDFLEMKVSKHFAEIIKNWDWDVVK